MKARNTVLLILLGLICIVRIAVGQPDNASDRSFETETVQIQFTDSFRLKKDLSEVLVKFWDAGYLEAEPFEKSFVKDSTIVEVVIRKGPVYRKGDIRIDSSILAEVKSINVIGRSQEFSFNEIKTIHEEIVVWYENHGHPFAISKFDSVEIEDFKFSGKIIAEKGPRIIYDSIIVTGNARISNTYISNLLGIKKGDEYCEERNQKINQRIEGVPFLQVKSPPELIFYEDKASVILKMNKSKSNQFNGILGVLPDDKVQGKMLLTGDVKLSLVNSFGAGERIYANWQKLQVQSQRLLVEAEYPYLLQTKAGIATRFQLYRKDTSYVNLNVFGGISWAFQYSNRLSAYIEYKSSSIISTDIYRNATSLPPFADTKTMLYGLEYSFEDLDFRLNPTSGYTFVADLAVGKKQIIRNNELPEHLYDDVAPESSQIEAKGTGAVFIPVFRKFTLCMKASGGIIENDLLFENELYMIGGLKTVRGMDEESVFASSYGVITGEFRYLFEKYSNVYLFFDGGWYEKKLKGVYLRDTPIGFGAGLSLKTGAGIFTISYALGRQFDNPIQLRSSKVHFGYINNF